MFKKGVVYKLREHLEYHGMEEKSTRFSKHLVTQSEIPENVIILTINPNAPLIKGRTYAGF